MFRSPTLGMLRLALGARFASKVTGQFFKLLEKVENSVIKKPICLCEKAYTLGLKGFRCCRYFRALRTV